MELELDIVEDNKLLIVVKNGEKVYKVKFSLSIAEKLIPLILAIVLKLIGK